MSKFKVSAMTAKRSRPRRRAKATAADVQRMTSQSLDRISTPLPPALFEIFQPVVVPSDVHPSCKAKIVGCEFGNSYSRKTNHGWVYYLAFEGGGIAWEASEEELVKWQAANIESQQGSSTNGIAS